MDVINTMEIIAKIYEKYNAFDKLFDFPISGNYTNEQFPNGVAEILRICKKDILSMYARCFTIYPIIMAIGSGNINDKTGCELYTILYVPFIEVPDVLILLYDEDGVQNIYSKLIQMYNKYGHNKLPFVIAISVQHDYNCIFQISN